MKTNILLISLFFNFSIQAAFVTSLAPEREKPEALLKVPTPYPFKQIQAGEKYQYLPQMAGAFMTRDAKFDYLIAGPLQPCVLIRFRNIENGQILAFHMHWMNSLLSIKRSIDALEFSDRSKVDVAILSFHHKGAEAGLSQVMPDWNQSSELKRIARFMVKELKIPSSNIEQKLFEKPPELKLGQYSLLYSGYTAIDKNGDLFSIDPHTSDIFGLSQDKIQTLDAKTKKSQVKKYDELSTTSQMEYFMQIDKSQQEEIVRTHLKLKKTDSLPWQAPPGQHAVRRGTIHFFMLNPQTIFQKPEFDEEGKK